MHNLRLSLSCRIPLADTAPGRTGLDARVCAVRLDVRVWSSGFVFSVCSCFTPGFMISVLDIA